MLPEEYIQKMKNILKDEYPLYEKSFNDKAIHSLRVNTSKISVSDFLKIFPYKLEAIPWTNDGFYYEDEEVSKHLFFHLGLYYIQEASAMLPAEILPIEQGDIVLDACAAPGGKSLKILNKLANTGLLVANDISASRCSGLLRNIEKQGYSNYFVSCEDINNLARKIPHTFDKILLDAPCSGEGMFRKDPSLIKSWLNKNNNYYSNIQKEIIKNALSLLKEDGYLLYSTCTFDPEEDEKIIEYALSLDDNLKVEPIKLYPGFKSGLNNLGVKLYPHLVKGEGHYVCLLKKGKQTKKEHQETTPSKPDILKDYNLNLHDGEYRIINDNLYFVPDFNIDHLRLLRSGLLLGKLNKYGFEPSQALAHYLTPLNYQKTINLELNDPRIFKYLKGETISLDTNLEGYILLCTMNIPLGFVKIKNGQVKNKIDKGWIVR